MKTLLIFPILFFTCATSLYGETVQDLNTLFEQEKTHLTALIEELRASRVGLNTMASLDDKENAVLAHIDTVLRDKNQLILTYQSLNRDLQRKVRDKELSFAKRLQYEWEKRGLGQDIDLRVQTVKSLQNELNRTQAELASLKMEQQRSELSHSHTLEVFEQRVAQLNKKLEDKNPHFQEHHNEMTQNMQEIRSLQTQLDQELREVARLKSQLALKDEALEKMLAVNRDLNLSLMKAEKKIAFLMDENSTLANRLAHAESELHQTIRMAQDQKHHYARREHTLISQALDASSPTLLAQSGSRSPASAAVAYDVAHRLNEALSNFDLEAIQSEGKVIISLSEELFFETDQTELTDLNKATLLSLFTLYAESIFQDEKLKDQLVGIEFVGHASPWFQSAFVHPLDASDEAYHYNLMISLERARSLAQFIFSGDFGDFPYKNAMRQMTRVLGAGMSEPVPLRGPASSNKTCGGFDCQASRRVEIIFSFEQDQDS